MPQMTKGDKFLLEKSLIQEDITVHLPLQAIIKYNIVAEVKFISLPEVKSSVAFVSQGKDYYTLPN